MADKTSQLILDALSRAAVEPSGVPLVGPKAVPGLFAATALAKKAAKHCKDQDYLRVVRIERHGKSEQEVVAITDKGLEHLLHHKDLGEILSDVVRAVEGREKQLAELVVSVEQTQASIAALRELAQGALQRLDVQRAQKNESQEDHGAALVQALRNWRASVAAGDCSLTYLYKQIKGMTIGEFHDLVRRLYAEERVYLHPWTGPLSELPEPEMTLMVGHEIAYYASVRDEA